MKVLLILRHAKSSWTSDALGDHERPLNPRGVRNAPRMGALLEEQDLVPDLIISSDAVRARMTAEAVVKTSGYAAEIVFDPRLYLASPDDIIAVLRSTPSADTRTVMIVGHNPGLEDLVAQLTGEERELPTAALAVISLPLERWNDLATESRGAVLALWRPKDLT